MSQLPGETKNKYNTCVLLPDDRGDVSHVDPDQRKDFTDVFGLESI